MRACNVPNTAACHAPCECGRGYAAPKMHDHKHKYIHALPKLWWELALQAQHRHEAGMRAVMEHDGFMLACPCQLEFRRG